jgi:electron transport complex protein RnfC
MSAPTFDLGKLHGGLRLDAQKAESTAGLIRAVPVPAQLVLPLAQHVGAPAHPVVSVGEPVLKGQLIAEHEGSLGAPVHASSSGTVIAIEAWPIVRRYGDRAPCIIIETDGEDQPVDPPSRRPWTDMTSQELAQQILEGGIVASPAG